MSIVTVKNKYQVVIPKKVRRKVRVNIGDVLEAKAERGKIILTPKLVVDRTAANEYTPRQRRIIDAHLAKALGDVKKGRTYGPFDSADEMIASMKAELKKRTLAKKNKRHS